MGGKLPPDLLEKLVISRTGAEDPSVIIGPRIGEDAAIIDIGDNKVLVVHSDPITGAIENLGWLSVHVACNDIAVRGARPRWLLPVLFLPEGSGGELVDRITSQIDEAAKEIGASIVGGHSEYTHGLSRPLISMTALGITRKDRYISTSGARDNDVVIMTKAGALEGTSILSTDFRSLLLDLGLPEGVIRRGQAFIKMVSVVREALYLAETGYVTSMHDPTEGGILGGLAEVAYASGKTIEVWEDKIPFEEETILITRALGVDPLRLISSGALIATVRPDKVEELLKALSARGIRAAVIGRVSAYTGHYVILHRNNGEKEQIDDVYVSDEIYKVWEKFGR